MFKIRERGSTVGTEVRGGFATFFTMAYIIVLNPIILASAADINGDKLDIGQLTTVTALTAAVMTLAMGLFANLPVAMAAGLGLNGVVAFQLAPQMTWEGAMGVVVIEGLVILLLALSGWREKAFNAVPPSLRYAIAVGIGLFIAYIGFVDAGFIRRNPDAAVTPVPGGLGIEGRLAGWPTLVFVVGVLLMGLLLVRRVKGAIVIGIVATTIFAMVVNWLADVPAAFGPDGKYNPEGWALNVPQLPSDWFVGPDFGLLGNFSFADAFDVGVITLIVLAFTIALADFFDTVGTGTAVGAEAGLLDNQGRLPRLRRFLAIDALGAVFGGAASSSSNTSYIESLSGVSDGAKTGVASLTTGGLFLVGLVMTPIVLMVPHEAAAPALVIVGFLLMTQITNINWRDYEEAIPAFLTLLLMPVAFSITVGIGAGFVSYAVLRLVNGKFRNTPFAIFFIAALFVIYFAIKYVERLLGVT